MSAEKIRIDFNAVYCNPHHMKDTGSGWAKRLRELGANEVEIESLVMRLKNGVAAEIELARIHQLRRSAA